MEFPDAFHLLLGHEGGYVDHPDDPGGATRWGVTERVARAAGYTGDMRELPVEFAQGVYRREYWRAVRCDELPARLRYPVFDAAVNSGPRQAVRWMQRALGVSADGVIGPITLGAAARADIERVRAHMLGQRLAFMANLPGWRSFSRGWALRVGAVLTGD